MADVIAGSGYHVMAVQEAREDFLQLDTAKWSSVLVASQCVLARAPAVVRSLASADTKQIAWLLAEIRYPQPVLGFSDLRIISLHLNCTVAKKANAGPEALGAALDAASSAGVPDIVCGDINMARFRKASARMLSFCLSCHRRAGERGSEARAEAAGAGTAARCRPRRPTVAGAYSHEGCRRN